MKDIVVGSVFRFARGGETIDGGVVSSLVKPDTDPENNWTEGPAIEAAEITPIAGSRILRRAPVNGGRYAVRKALTLGRGLEIKLSLQQASPLVFEHLFNLPEKAVADTAQLAGGKSALDTELWAKLQMYDHEDEAVFYADLWCALMIAPYSFGEKLDPYALTLTVLHSDLNSGVVKNLTEGA